VGHLVGLGPAADLFLILFLFYLGYIALWSAIEDPDTAADLTAVLCLVGTVFAVLSRYAAFFWSQGLHQGASLSRAPGTRMDWAYKAPLYVCMAALALLFLALVLAGTRTEIRARRSRR
jgi:heme exporter protein C